MTRTNRLASVLAVMTLAFAATPAAADSFAKVDVLLGNNTSANETSVPGGQPTVSTSLVAGPADFAMATASIGAGSVGIALQTSTPESLAATAQTGDVWNFCDTRVQLCGVIGLAPVTLQFDLAGTLSADWLSRNEPGQLSGEVDIGSSDFTFQYDSTAQDITGTFCSTARACSNTSFAVVINADGSLSFNDSFGFDDLLPDSFDSSIALSGGWDPSIGPSSIGFADTLGFSIVSNSSESWTSDGGRSSTAAGGTGTGTGTTSVPEPGTLSLLGLALGGLGWLRRRLSR